MPPAAYAKPSHYSRQGVEGVNVRLEVHVGRFGAGSFSPNFAYNLCWAGSVPKSNYTILAFRQLPIVVIPPAVRSNGANRQCALRPLISTVKSASVYQSRPRISWLSWDIRPSISRSPPASTADTYHRSAASAIGATYTSLGQRPGKPQAKRPNCPPPCLHSLQPTPTRSPSPSAQDLSSPRSHPKPPNPASTLAIYIFKTWHSYPHPIATIEIALNSSDTTRSLPPSAQDLSSLERG